MMSGLEENCPICFDPLPVASFRRNIRHWLLCCGKSMCLSCYRRLEYDAKWRRLKCPLCRTFQPSTEEAKFVLVKSRVDQHGWNWAHNTLANYYGTGMGCTFNAKEAFIHYLKAANNGYITAQYVLGNCYLLGKGVMRSLKEAMYWYGKASTNGFAIATFLLRAIEEITKKNIVEALHLIDLAATQGSDLAQCALAFAYKYGKGVRKSLQMSMYWYKQAADQGNSVAMAKYASSLVYLESEKSNGILNSPGKSPIPEALYWARKSVALGFTQALRLVEQLEAILVNSCIHCKKLCHPSKLYRCTRCRTVMYCSSVCKSAHWKAGHVLDCWEDDEVKRTKERNTNLLRWYSEMRENDDNYEDDYGDDDQDDDLGGGDFCSTM